MTNKVTTLRMYLQIAEKLEDTSLQILFEKTFGKEKVDNMLEADGNDPSKFLGYPVFYDHKTNEICLFPSAENQKTCIFLFYFSAWDITTGQEFDIKDAALEALKKHAIFCTVKNLLDEKSIELRFKDNFGEDKFLQMAGVKTDEFDKKNIDKNKYAVVFKQDRYTQKHSINIIHWFTEENKNIKNHLDKENEILLTYISAHDAYLSGNDYIKNEIKSYFKH